MGINLQRQSCGTVAARCTTPSSSTPSNANWTRPQLIRPEPSPCLIYPIVDSRFKRRHRPRRSRPTTPKSPAGYLAPFTSCFAPFSSPITINPPLILAVAGAPHFWRRHRNPIKIVITWCTISLGPCSPPSLRFPSLSFRHFRPTSLPWSEDQFRSALRPLQSVFPLLNTAGFSCYPPLFNYLFTTLVITWCINFCIACA